MSVHAGKGNTTHSEYITEICGKIAFKKLSSFITKGGQCKWQYPQA